MQFEFSNKLLNLLFFFLIYVPESGHMSGNKTQTFKMILADGNIYIVARGSISEYRHFCPVQRVETLLALSALIEILHL